MDHEVRNIKFRIKVAVNAGEMTDYIKYSSIPSLSQYLRIANMQLVKKEGKAVPIHAIPLILSPSTRQKRIVTFTPRPSYPRERTLAPKPVWKF